MKYLRVIIGDNKWESIIEWDFAASDIFRYGEKGQN